jgi:protein-tyrosine phosphatase
MIDLHSHILPGVDDGAPGWDTALAMMGLAARSGTRVLVATPHSWDGEGGSGSRGERIATLVALANERAAGAGLALQVLPGEECLAGPGLVEDLRAGRRLALGGSNTVLLELPFALWPPYLDRLVFELQVAGYTVLLAHPERYRAVVEDPNRIFSLVERGVVTQVNSTSLLGRAGRKTQEVARLLLEHDLVHVLASDAHDARGRPPLLREACDLAGSWIGEEAARRLVEETPRRLLDDEMPVVGEPRWIEPARHRKWFAWL